MIATTLALVISYANTEQLWTQAGGSKNLASTMAAVANAESHLRFGTANYDRHELGGSFCGWQINIVHTTIRGGPFDRDRLLKDPHYCAKAAVYVANHQGLRAWTTYREGTFLSYMRPEKHATHAPKKPRVTPQEFLAYAKKFHRAPPRNWTPHRHRIRHISKTHPVPKPLNEVQIVLAGIVAVFLASNLVKLGVRIDAQNEAYRRRTRRRSLTPRPLRHRRQAMA